MFHDIGRAWYLPAWLEHQAPMTNRLDQTLKVLDVGLQSSHEHGYGTDHTPGHCARCRHHEPANGGDLCTGCRSYLLGDVELDPKTAPTTATYHDVAAALQTILDAFTSAAQQIADAFTAAFTSSNLDSILKATRTINARQHRRDRHARWQARNHRRR